MWQGYLLGSLLAGAFESVTDKAALVWDGKVDTAVATFYRLLFFFGASVAVGLLGVLGGFSLFFHWTFLLFIPFSAITSYLYTYLLRHVEITVIGAAAYLTPFLFLLVDTTILDVPLSFLQIGGVVLLVLGGAAFSLDGKTRRINAELTLPVLGVFLLGVLYTGTEAYLFKHLNESYGLNAVSFLVNVWGPVCVLALLYVVAMNKSHLLWNRAARIYIPFVAVSKTFDSFNSILYIAALSLAAVSQVTAFEALFPLFLFAVAVLVQGIFHLPLREKMDWTRLRWKFGAVCFLVLGGFLVG